MKLMKKVSAFFIAGLIISTIFITSYANTYSISIQNINPSISINNNVYSAYLLFEAVENNSGAYVFNPSTCLAVSYTPSGGTPLSGSQLISWLSDPLRTANELHDFSTSVYNNYIDINPAPTPSGSGTATGQQATIPLTLAGYYVVTGGGERADNHSPITALASLSVINPTATINPKFDVPLLDKLVYHDNENAYTEYSDHAVGDDVLYQIKTTVPATTGYTSYNYIISDTLDAGLTFNNNLSLYVQTPSGKTNIPTSYYTLNTSPGQGKTFTLDIDILSLIDDGIISVSDTLLTEFSATLNENAIVDPDGTNDNNAVLTYSNNPQNLHSTGNTPTSTTKSYTFKVQINKTDSTSHLLDGAEFVMTLDEELKTDGSGNPTNALEFMQNPVGFYTLAPSSYGGITTSVLTAGTMHILGLNSNVNYYLHEITPPNGYAPTSVPTYFSLYAEYDAITGELLPGYPNMLVNGATTPVAPELDIINYKDNTLPETGDNAVLIFCISGLFLVLTATLVFFIAQRGARNVKT